MRNIAPLCHWVCGGLRWSLVSILAACCMPTLAQLTTCNFLGISGGTVFTTIPAGTNIIDGGSVDGSSSAWCNIQHLEVQAGGGLYNGRVARGPGLTTQFENGFTTGFGVTLDSSLTNRGTVENGAYGIFFNRVGLTNYAVLRNLGVMTNAGESPASPGDAAFIDNRASGRFDNAGTLFLEGKANRSLPLLTNAGTVTNSGIVDNYGLVINTNTIENHGSWVNRSAAVLSLGTVGVIINRRSFDNAGAIGLPGGTGVFENASAGTLLNTGQVGGMMINDGSIENRGFLDHSSYSGTGSVQNLASMAVRGDMTVGGRIINYDLVTVGGNLHLDAGAAVADANLANYGRIAVAGNVAVASFGFLNIRAVGADRGALDIGGSFLVDGSVTNEGRVDVRGTTPQPQGTGTYVQIGSGAETFVDGLLSVGRFRLEGGVLGGSGTIQGEYSAGGGTLAPGNSLTFVPFSAAAAAQAATDPSFAVFTVDGDLSMTAGRILLEIGGTAAGAFDRLHITGNATFEGGTLELAFADGFLPTLGDHWNLLTVDGTLFGFDTLRTIFVGLPDNYQLSFSLTSTGVDVAFGSAAPVPEPAEWALMLVGLGLMGVCASGKRRGRGVPPS